MARRVVFDTTLYADEAVEAAAAAYREHAKVSVRRDGGGTVVILESRDLDDELVHSFCNHVLFETVVRRRRADAVEPT